MLKHHSIAHCCYVKAVSYNVDGVLQISTVPLPEVDFSRLVRDSAVMTELSVFAGDTKSEITRDISTHITLQKHYIMLGKQGVGFAHLNLKFCNFSGCVCLRSYLFKDSTKMVSL